MSWPDSSRSPCVIPGILRAANLAGVGGVSAEALQLSAIQVLLRKSSQQIKPLESDLKNKNQEINAVLFTVSLR